MGTLKNITLTLFLLMGIGIALQIFIGYFDLSEMPSLLIVPAVMPILATLVASVAPRKTVYRKTFAILSIVGWILFALWAFLVYVLSHIRWT